MSRKQPLSRWLSAYQPKPGPAFEQKMTHAPWKITEETMTHSVSRRPSLGWQIALAFALALIVLSLSIPAVRAALSAWLGLSVAPSNQMPAAAVTLVAVTPPAAVQTTAATAVPVSENPALPVEISGLSAQAGWRILAPTRLPEGYRFQSAYFDPQQSMVLLTYTVTRPLPGASDPALTETKSVTVLQAQTNDFIPMQIAPATGVTDVQVAGQPAAYAVGAWDSEFVKHEQDPNGGKMVSTWRSELPVQNLYWQVGDIYLVLISDDAALRQQDLIDLAASFNMP